MRCCWRNHCKFPDLCCSDCKEPNCWQRCKDKQEGCKYSLPDLEETQDASFKSVVTDPEVSKSNGQTVVRRVLFRHNG